MVKVKYDALFLCQFFFPECNSSATLPWDAAKYLASKGFKISAMCGYPKEYNMEGTVSTEDWPSDQLFFFHVICSVAHPGAKKMQVRFCLFQSSGVADRCRPGQSAI